jgi:DNA polymerase (family 10)
MNNSDIAGFLELTAKLMELHGENPFKIKALASAAFRIDKMNTALASLDTGALEQQEGIGKGIAAKIKELSTRGTTAEFESLREKTPDGIFEMMGIKGIGPKKVAMLWKELGINNRGELEYACMENRLVQLKGFGEKTQEALLKNLRFMKSQEGWFHYARVEPIAVAFLSEIRKAHPDSRMEPCGAYARKMEVLQSLEFVVSEDFPTTLYSVAGDEQVPLIFYPAAREDFASLLFQKNCSEPFYQSWLEHYGSASGATNEKEIFEKARLPFLPPETREGAHPAKLAEKAGMLIQMEDLKGLIHNHSTWSDGADSLKDMAQAARDKGFEYLVISDHSKSAFYASGLNETRVQEQWKEIDSINQLLSPFKIYKSIESDILNDGQLDYDDEFIKGFDLVIASVHSNLRMTEEKATHRLIKAIEHPATRILGHMTGRLLLTREGYPLDTEKILDACAANGVVIELNAHPYRLDIDWRLIPRALDKGILISINPDAHAIAGFDDLRYGVNVARKGLLTREHCLNAKNLSAFESWVNDGKAS